MNNSLGNSIPIETRLFAAAALLALLLLLWVPLPLALQIGLLAMAVAVLGVPHGALDSWIARRSGVYMRRSGWVGFNLAYLGLAATVVAAWWQFPVTSLVLFLLISAWHFSGDWRAALPPWQCLATAAALLGMPAVFHFSVVVDIFAVLSGPDSQIVADGLRSVGLAAMAILGPILVVAGRNQHWNVVIEVGLLIVLAWAAPPLVYFTIYFCLLHSPRHLRATLALADEDQRRSLISQGVLYTLVTLALAGGAAAFLVPGTVSDIGLQVVFIGLAALTVPHMLLMLWSGSAADQ